MGHHSNPGNDIWAMKFPVIMKYGIFQSIRSQRFKKSMTGLRIDEVINDEEIWSKNIWKY